MDGRPKIVCSLRLMKRDVFIDRRFNGPPHSANGGYACGVVAEGIDGVAAVRLRVPPPLDQPMTLDGDGESARLTDRETLVGEARSAELDLQRPRLPTIAQAREAVESYVGFDFHPFETCFVCGPKRGPGDGLQIFPGLVDGTDIVASPWSPDETLLDDDGAVESRHVWAALDCPSYFGIPGTPPAVLAQLTADIQRLPVVGEPLVVMGWHDHTEGRKHFSGSALATDEGEVVAAASALWIEPSGGLPV